MIKLIDILNEIKVNNPLKINPVSLDTLKEALVKDIYERYHELLDGEESEEEIQNHINKFSELIKDKTKLYEIAEVYEEIGFGDIQMLIILQKILIK